MKYIIHCILWCLVPYCSTEFIKFNRKNVRPHCEGTEKNAIIEHFFNVIFTEFQATPPVCVCVQMCVGQSTYCYPNACLRRDDLRRVDAPQAPPEVAVTASSDRQFMFVVDETPDFSPGFIDNPVGTENKGTPMETTTIKPVVLPYNPDYFKDYNSFKKFRKPLPQMELRYNLRESVKNLKSDILKMDNVDLAKTRWPMNKYNVVSGHRLRSAPDIISPAAVGKSKFFMSMLTDNNVANYPPKYFKRDLQKSTDDLSNFKEVYVFDNTENFTSFSLETLIDNLIKVNVETNSELLSVLNGTDSKGNEDISFELTVIPLNYSGSAQDQQTNKTDILSINMTPENNDKNKYTEQNDSKKFNGMISVLAKRIEKQNNTSMEMAKCLVADLDKELTTEEVFKETKSVTEELNTENVSNKTSRSVNTETKLEARHDEITPTTVANVIEATVTKKVKTRSPRKLGSKTQN